MNDTPAKKRSKKTAESSEPPPKDRVQALEEMVSELATRVFELEKRNFHSDWHRRIDGAIKKEKA